MNLALGTLIILILLLPALFFRLGITAVNYHSLTHLRNGVSFTNELARRNFLRILTKLNFSETIFFFSVIPIMIHCISLCVLKWLGEEIDFILLVNVLSSQKNIVNNNSIFNGRLISFLNYSLFTNVIGLLTGLIATQLMIRSPKLINIFTGENMYLMLFSGLLLDKSKRNLIDLIFIDIVSETKEVSVIYSGVLEKFDIMPDRNELAYVTLTDTTRRDLRKNFMTEEDDHKKSTFYNSKSGLISPISGMYFTIPGSKISTINVTYMSLLTIDGPNGPMQQMVPIN